MLKVIGFNEYKQMRAELREDALAIAGYKERISRLEDEIKELSRDQEELHRLRCQVAGNSHTQAMTQINGDLRIYFEKGTGTFCYIYNPLYMDSRGHSFTEEEGTAIMERLVPGSFRVTSGRVWRQRGNNGGIYLDGSFLLLKEILDDLLEIETSIFSYFNAYYKHSQMLNISGKAK